MRSARLARGALIGSIADSLRLLGVATLRRRRRLSCLSNLLRLWGVAALCRRGRLLCGLGVPASRGRRLVRGLAVGRVHLALSLLCSGAAHLFSGADACPRRLRVSFASRAGGVRTALRTRI